MALVPTKSDSGMVAMADSKLIEHLDHIDQSQDGCRDCYRDRISRRTPPAQKEVGKSSSQATASAALDALREAMLEAETPCCSSTEVDLSELRAMEALVRSTKLELATMIECNEQLEEELSRVQAATAKVDRIRKSLKDGKQALDTRKDQRRQQARARLQDLAEEIETWCDRLQAVRVHRRNLLIARSARTCKAVKPIRGSLGKDAGMTVLVFRGGHRLRVMKSQQKVNLRFEPWIPCLTACDSDSGKKLLLRRLEEMLCKIWLEATDHRSRRIQIEVTESEVASVVNRLDFLLLSASEAVAGLLLEASRNRGFRELAQSPA
eukprot:CAMPEP_0206443978 /NCGR_PEP_ID=MMETSP0324_2-20121206/14665_1 /ASSEMBLY_ACC=CAM_ASM_000836 /TAXON_ID=2866 /ORGANISM="Crypthecodinium cohnii, Strain Seligo" /LENGTH=321 /DNA_ID=CAMNT_0053911967 /DNA_START=12 /DNA_END=977 /DNA_ORIENTATION=+